MDLRGSVGTQEEVRGGERRWKCCKYSTHSQKIQIKREGIQTMFAF